MITTMPFTHGAPDLKLREGPSLPPLSSQSFQR